MAISYIGYVTKDLVTYGRAFKKVTQNSVLLKFLFQMLKKKHHKHATLDNLIFFYMGYGTPPYPQGRSSWVKGVEQWDYLVWG